jgi:hypothetical protein
LGLGGWFGILGRGFGRNDAGVGRRKRRRSRGLETVQLFEGAVIVALVGIYGALEAVKAGVGFGVGFTGTFPFVVFTVFAPGESDCAAVKHPEVGFDAAQAAEMPFVADERIDQRTLIGVGGRKLLVELGREAGEILGVFVIHNLELGVDAMLEGIVAGRRLSFGSTRAGAFFGVQTVGFLLLKS